MAITQTTISKSAGWPATDVILQLEEAFNWLGWHGETQSGIVTGINYYTNGGTLPNQQWYSHNYYQDVTPITTSGIGTGASFYVHRYGGSGSINKIWVNRPGIGYTHGEVVTISAADIGNPTGYPVTQTSISNTLLGAASLTTSTTPINGNDNGYWSLTLPFNVTYNGTSYGSVHVATNSYIRFGSPDGSIDTGSGDVIKISNADNSGQRIYYGTEGSAPNRTYRIRFEGTNATTGTLGSPTIVWEAIFYEANPSQFDIQCGANNSTQAIERRGFFTNGTTFLSRPIETINAGTRVTFGSLGPLNMTLQLNVDGGASPVGYGTTTAFYDKEVSAGSATPWGVMRHVIQPNKKYGTTYRAFQVSGTTLIQKTGSTFHPYNVTNTSDKGNGYSNRFAGEMRLDVYSDNNTQESTQIQLSNTTGLSYGQFSGAIATSNAYALDLNIFRSGLDPNFAVLSFRQPTLSSTHLAGNTFLTFIVHNFTTSIWDLDYLFLGGTTVISPDGLNTSNPHLIFNTYITNSDNTIRRMAEYGYYLNYFNYKRSRYHSSSYVVNYNDYLLDVPNTYYRENTSITDRGTGGNPSYTNLTYLPSETNYNAVVKGIPLNTTLVPCPYYIPDDFVLIHFNYAAPGANIQQGDTITISGSEVYTVVTGSYNQNTRTRGILFCARTV